MDQAVEELVSRVLSAGDRRAPAELPGAGRPFDPSRGVPLEQGSVPVAPRTAPTAGGASFSVHPPLPTLREAPDERGKAARPTAAHVPPRPNYQREHARGRIRVTELKASGATPGVAVPRPDAPDAVTRDEAALRTRAVGALATSAAPQPSAPVTGSRHPSTAICAGCRRDEGAVSLELVEDVCERTRRVLGLPCRPGETVLVATARSCSLAQLFAVDAVSGQMAGLSADLAWREDAGAAFRLFCHGAADAVRSVRDELSRALATPGPWLVREPGEVLRRRLHAPSGAVLGVAGRPPLALAGVLDAFFRERPDATVDAVACCDGTVAVGPADELVVLATRFSPSVRTTN